METQEQVRSKENDYAITMEGLQRLEQDQKQPTAPLQQEQPIPPSAPSIPTAPTAPSTPAQQALSIELPTENQESEDFFSSQELLVVKKVCLSLSPFLFPPFLFLFKDFSLATLRDNGFVLAPYFLLLFFCTFLLLIYKLFWNLLWEYWFRYSKVTGDSGSVSDFFWKEQRVPRLNFSALVLFLVFITSFFGAAYFMPCFIMLHPILAFYFVFAFSVFMNSVAFIYLFIEFVRQLIQSRKRKRSNQPRDRTSNSPPGLFWAFISIFFPIISTYLIYLFRLKNSELPQDYFYYAIDRKRCELSMSKH